MNHTTRVIDFSEINLEDFEEGYKESFKELIELKNEGVTNMMIHTSFNKNGEFIGELRDRDKPYTLEDNKIKGCYYTDCPDTDITKIRPLLIEWEQEVFHEIKEKNLRSHSM